MWFAPKCHYMVVVCGHYQHSFWHVWFQQRPSPAPGNMINDGLVLHCWQFQSPDLVNWKPPCNAGIVKKPNKEIDVIDLICRPTLTVERIQMMRGVKLQPMSCKLIWSTDRFLTWTKVRFPRLLKYRITTLTIHFHAPRHFHGTVYNHWNKSMLFAYNVKSFDPQSLELNARSCKERYMGLLFYVLSVLFAVARWFRLRNITWWQVPVCFRDSFGLLGTITSQSSVNLLCDSTT